MSTAEERYDALVEELLDINEFIAEAANYTTIEGRTLFLTEVGHTIRERVEYTLKEIEREENEP